MKILFVRHAQAEPLKDGVKDSERSLTGKGQASLMRRLEDIRAYFSNQDSVKLWASDYNRSVETAKLLEQGLGGVQTEIHKFLRKNKYDKLLDALKSADTDALLIVGHNPMMEEWIEALTGTAVEMKPMDAVCVNFDGEKGSVLWTWSRKGSVRVLPYHDEIGLDVQSWLEECAFALHSDILQSRLEFEEKDAKSTGDDRETDMMLNFLRIFSPILPEKRVKKALDRYMLCGESSFELYWLYRLIADIRIKSEDSAELVDRMEKIYEDERRILDKQILSFDSQKTYQKAFRSVIKGLRTADEELKLTDKKSLTDFLAARRQHLIEDAEREIDQIDLRDERAVINIGKRWKLSTSEDIFSARFVTGEVACLETRPFPYAELFRLYRLQRRLQFYAEMKGSGKNRTKQFKEYSDLLEARIEEEINKAEQARAKAPEESR